MKRFFPVKQVRALFLFGCAFITCAIAYLTLAVNVPPCGCCQAPNGSGGCLNITSVNSVSISGNSVSWNGSATCSVNTTPPGGCVNWSVTPADAGKFDVTCGTSATFTLTNPCPLTVTIKASCGSSSATATILRDVTPGPWELVPVGGPQGGTCSLTGLDTVLWSTNDFCGNRLELWCANADVSFVSRAYQFRYNGQLVGICTFRCGVNSFWFRFTSDGKLLHSTWHVTRDDVWNVICDSNSGKNDLCDELTANEYDWQVTRFYCLVAGSSPLCTCRHAVCYDIFGWDDPNNLLNAENQGTAQTCSACP